MRFEFIRTQSANYRIRTLCKVMDVSTSGYYAWRKRPVSTRGKDDENLSIEVRAIHKASRGRYGSPRVHRVLRKKRVVSRKREEGLAGRPAARFAKTTDSSHDDPVAANILGRDFVADAPNTKWAGDITYI